MRNACCFSFDACRFAFTKVRDQLTRKRLDVFVTQIKLHAANNVLEIPIAIIARAQAVGRRRPFALVGHANAREQKAHLTPRLRPPIHSIVRNRLDHAHAPLEKPAVVTLGLLEDGESMGCFDTHTAEELA